MENSKSTIIIVVIAILVFIAVTAVVLMDGNDNENKNETSKANETNTSAVNDEEEEEEDFDYLAAAEEQMKEPEEGETIAIMHVKNFGDITFKFFDEEAPKAVENFLTHAKDGYYDGVKFHRVMEEFMIQGGDPLGNGTGGESIWGTGFEEELSQSLVPYRGALCMASAGTGTSTLGSQFFIVQANADESDATTLSAYYPTSFVSAYLKYGGYPSLYGSYTVFGQVIDGMDVVDKIATVEKELSSSGELSSPIEDVIIESIEVKTK